MKTEDKELSKDVQYECDKETLHMDFDKYPFIKKRTENGWELISEESNVLNDSGSGRVYRVLIYRRPIKTPKDIERLKGLLETQVKKDDLLEMRGEITQEEIHRLLYKRGLTIEKVIDAVVDANGFIGVGLISLGDILKNYCYNHNRLRGTKPEFHGDKE